MAESGKTRQCLSYKALAAGMAVVLPVDAHQTSKTCPHCGRQYKPRGRVCRCPSCGLVAHRDVVGGVKILWRYREGELGRLLPAPRNAARYRHPSRTGKRSWPKTPDLAH